MVRGRWGQEQVVSGAGGVRECIVVSQSVSQSVRKPNLEPQRISKLALVRLRHQLCILILGQSMFTLWAPHLSPT